MENDRLVPISVHDDGAAEEWECRFCLDVLDERDEDVIKPCLCRSLVHRECLDRWRASRRNPIAFDTCEVCSFRYEVALQERTPSRSQKVKYMALVARDTLAVFVVTQIIICLLGWICQAADEDDHLRNLFPDFIARHTKTVYYLCGLTLFLAAIGAVGCVSYCCLNITGEVDAEHGPRLIQQPGPSCCGACCDACCRGNNVICIDCHCPSGGGGGNCDCKDAGGELFIVLVILVVIFALLGVLVGIFLFTIILQRILQRHMRVLWLREEARRYRVVDLRGQDVEQIRNRREREQEEQVAAHANDHHRHGRSDDRRSGGASAPPKTMAMMELDERFDHNPKPSAPPFAAGGLFDDESV